MVVISHDSQLLSVVCDDEERAQARGSPPLLLLQAACAAHLSMDGAALMHTWGSSFVASGGQFARQCAIECCQGVRWPAWDSRCFTLYRCSSRGV